MYKLILLFDLDSTIVVICEALFYSILFDLEGYCPLLFYCRIISSVSFFLLVLLSGWYRKTLFFVSPIKFDVWISCLNMLDWWKKEDHKYWSHLIFSLCLQISLDGTPFSADDSFVWSRFKPAFFIDLIKYTKNKICC